MSIKVYTIFSFLRGLPILKKRHSSETTPKLDKVCSFSPWEKMCARLYVCVCVRNKTPHTLMASFVISSSWYPFINYDFFQGITNQRSSRTMQRRSGRGWCLLPSSAHISIIDEEGMQRIDVEERNGNSEKGQSWLAS